MNCFPELLTSKLFLSAFSDADVQDVFSYASNPAVARFTSWQAHMSIQDSVGWLRFIHDNASLEAGSLRHCWAIRLRDNPRAIGAISFTQTSLERAHIDYVLAQEHWNKNLMTEAAHAVVDWAFQTLSDLQIIESGGLTENFGSMRVMQKCGMKLQKKELIRFAKFNNEDHEVSFYAIQRAEWETNKTRQHEAGVSPVPNLTPVARRGCA